MNEDPRCREATDPAHCERIVTCSLTTFGQAVAWTRRRFGVLALFGLLAPVAAGAAALAEPDASAVRKVVEAQLEAFAADDAQRAFSFASTSIQAQFGDAAAFMAMVRGSYPMVVRPAAVSFFLPQAAPGAAPDAAAARQNVQLRDRAGRLWLATYVLERQAGAGWRINGCMVVADSGKSMT